MADAIYDNGAGVRIERGTATINGKTYSIQNINSVSVEPAPTTKGAGAKGCGGVLVALGLLVGVAAIGTLNEGPTGYAVVAVVMIGVGVLLLRRPKPPTTWRLMFLMSNGEAEAIASTDRAAVDRVRDAIEQAMRPAAGS